jgi:molecular chaperone GrpE
MGETNNAFGHADSDQDQTAAPGSAPEQNVTKLTAELTATKDRLLRCLADQENIRRQAQRGREEAVQYAASQFARDLLQTADNLERAIASVPQEKRGDSALSSLLEGIEATRRALLDAFTRHGLRRLDPIGEKFDPNWHEASFELTHDRYPPGAVASVLQPGYLHHERLLRPALVGVSKSPDPPPASGEADNEADKRAGAESNPRPLRGS